MPLFLPVRFLMTGDLEYIYQVPIFKDNIITDNASKDLFSLDPIQKTWRVWKSTLLKTGDLPTNLMFFNKGIKT
jgi:hypothetical protein